MVAERRWKLASYEVAGKIGDGFSVPNGTAEIWNEIRVPSGRKGLKCLTRHDVPG
jgi:hypothetical protein